MSKKQNRAPAITQRETALGWLYWMLQIFVLQYLLVKLNQKLPTPLSNSWLNIIIYCVNFAFVILIFHKFLTASLIHAGKNFGKFLKASVLGFAVYWASKYALGWLVAVIAPNFVNVNDTAVAAMLNECFLPLALASILLVPLAEEMFFRGLLFRGLYAYNRPAAYIVSTLLFCAIHVAPHVGQYSWPVLAVCFVQYLPSGLCLAWAYSEADNIFAPILIHTINNALGIYSVR